MNPDLTDDDWFAEWQRFLTTLEGLLARKHEIIAQQERRAARLDQLLVMLVYLLMRLREDVNREVAGNLLVQTSETQQGREAIVITAEEMAFMNRYYVAAQLESEAEADQGIEAGKTVKDSIEKLFSFIPRHKTLLHGVNELLSLGRLA